MREFENIYCSCGGTVVEQNLTAKENDQYRNCPYGCCLRAYECEKCGVRWLFKLEAPEAF